MLTLEDKIEREVRKVVAGGDLRAAESYGKPFPETPGWDATPAALRMPFKILKDADFIPPEVELFHERARLRAELAAAIHDDEREVIRQRLNAVILKLTFRLEALRAHAQL